jgi:hypothetical protein
MGSEFLLLFRLRFTELKRAKLSEPLSRTTHVHRNVRETPIGLRGNCAIPLTEFGMHIVISGLHDTCTSSPYAYLLQFAVSSNLLGMAFGRVERSSLHPVHNLWPKMGSSKPELWMKLALDFQNSLRCGALVKLPKETLLYQTHPSCESSIVLERQTLPRENVASWF